MYFQCAIKNSIIINLAIVALNILNAQNIIKNPSFEVEDEKNKNLPAHYVGAPYNDEAKLEWSNIEARTGKRSLAISNTKKLSSWKIQGSVYEKINVHEKEEYIFSVYIKTENATGQNFLQVGFFNRQGEFKNAIKSTSIIGTNEWTKVEIICKIPDGIKFVGAYLCSYGNTGKVWFDDLSCQLYMDHANIKKTHIPFSKSTSTYQIKETNKKIDIDGNLDDWEIIDASVVKIESEDHIIDRGKQGKRNRWKGPKDLSVSLKGAYNSEGIFWAFTVEDDVFFQKTRNWKEDSLQISFDSLYNRTDTLDDNDYRYNFYPYKNSVSIDAPNMAHEHCQDTRNVKASFKRQGSHTIYEIFIPWHNVKPFDLSKSNKMGFTFQVNDEDSEKTDFKALEFSPSGGTDRPSCFATLIFPGKGNNFLLNITEPKGQHLQEKTPRAVFNIAATNETNCAIDLFINKLKIHSEKLVLEPGVTEFTVPTNLLQGGLRQGGNSFEVRITSKKENISDSILFHCYDDFALKNEISQLQENLKSKLSTLMEKIKNKERESKDTTIQKAAYTVGKMFSQWVPYDLLRINNREEWNKLHPFPIIHSELVEANKVVSNAIFELDSLALNKIYPKGRINDSSFLFSFMGACDIGGASAPHKESGYMSIKEFIVDYKAIGGGFDMLNAAFSNSYYGNSPSVLSEKVRIFKESGLLVDARLRWGLIFPKDLITEYPDLCKIKGNHLFPWDPDQPSFRKCAESIVKKYSEITSKPFAMELATEPEFTSFTEHTKIKFKKWLQNEYKTIEKLNVAWGTSYKGFNEATAFPLNSTARKYDWYKFNQLRVLDFFVFLNSILKKHAPKTKSYVQVVSQSRFNFASRPRFETGIDIEAIGNAMDIVGFDTVVNRRPHPGYCTFWQAQSISVDFLASVIPNKMIYDAEWHAQDKYDLSLLPENTSTSLWLAFLHGESMNRSFYWVRNKPLRPFFELKLLPYSVGGRPDHMYAYAKTAWELRRLESYVKLFAKANREIKIFYSNTSFLLSPYKHLLSQGKVYEGAYFCDKSIGFLTEKTIKDAQFTSECKLLIIPEVDYMPDDSFAAIKDFVNSGKSVILLGNSNFKYNKKGKIRNNWKIGNADNVIKIPSNLSPLEYRKIILDYLKKNESLAPIRLATPKGASPWGIEMRSVKLSDKDYLVYLANLSDKNQNVTIKTDVPISQYENLLNGAQTNFVSPLMEPFDIKLYKIKF